MSSLVEKAKQFRVSLDAARKRAGPVNFGWYPYNSLSSVQHLQMLLGDSHEHVMESARKEGVLDLGCGDGDLGFFLESLGYRVTGVDSPAANQNCMQGLKALRRELQSSVEIREIDVDSEFPLDSKYGLTVCLGLLYHLKNPFFVLERLARISRFCVLSTRIARRLPDGAPMPENHALAYLVGDDELNRDDTNYWIFSEPALRRLLERTSWKIVQFVTTGDTVASDPVNPDHDERAFCLLESHYGCQHLELLEGWHHVEDSGWRWTERRFTARATSHSRGKHSTITMRVYAPPLLIQKFGSVSLHARVNGVDSQPFVMSEPGIHLFVRKISRATEITSVEFHLDNVLGPDAEYSRELGIVVASLEFA